MNFKKEVIDASHKEAIVVQFTGATCPPCQVMKPLLTDLSISRRDFKFVLVDAWKERELSKKYGVWGVPHVVMFQDGVVSERYKGPGIKTHLDAWLNRTMILSST